MIDMFLKDIPDNFADEAIQVLKIAIRETTYYTNEEADSLERIQSIFVQLSQQQKENPNKAMHVVDFT